MVVGGGGGEGGGGVRGGGDDGGQEPPVAGRPREAKSAAGHCCQRTSVAVMSLVMSSCQQPETPINDQPIAAQ